MYDNFRVTTDHAEIRRWVEEHDGVPASVAEKITPNENVGILRIIFKGERNPENLTVMSWDEFFTRFDQANLAFQYEKSIPGGKKSNYYKFLSCDGE
ncbi:MAG: hypothetical protein GX267_03330 [Fibrobacter sp.]|jgi:hypothetical protein|nr:hypothetical protein [Fibrobacter sp.]